MCAPVSALSSSRSNFWRVISPADMLYSSCSSLFHLFDELFHFREVMITSQKLIF